MSRTPCWSSFFGIGQVARPPASPARRPGRRSAAPARRARSTSRSGSSMRAARSSTLVNTTARPRCRSSSGEAARVLDDGAVRGEVAAQDRGPALRRAAAGPAARSPRRSQHLRPPRCSPPRLAGHGQRSPGAAAAAAPSSRPGCRRPRTAPPSGTGRRAGCWRCSGVSRLKRSNSSSGSVEAQPAGDGDQVDDRVRRAADRHRDADRVLERLRRHDLRRPQPLLAPSRTIRRPLASASRRRRESGAGMAAQPGSAMPSASAMLAIVLAVPITMQWPALRQRRVLDLVERLLGDRAGAQLGLSSGGSRCRRRGPGRASGRSASARR